MEVFLTDSVALTAPAPGVDATEAERRAEQFRRQFVPEGMPFVLGEDGSYDWVLNRFLRSLPTSGVRSAHSWRAYVLDVVTWARFLEEYRGRSVLEARREDLEAFYAARRLSPAPYRVSAATWDRLVAALEKFYRWALSTSLIERPLFGYERLQPSGEMAVVGAREKVSRPGDVRFLSLPRYVAFRDVGVRGWAPGGGEDAGFVGRCGGRNAVFADLCVTTGLRLEEANSLLACELPAVDTSDGARSARFELAPLTTKGDRGRCIRIPHRVLRHIRDYVEAERCVAVQRGAGRGAFAGPRWIPVRAPDRRGGQMRRPGGRWSAVVWADLNPAERSRLVEVDEAGEPVGPLALWLSERGAPMAASSWESVFDRASSRCRRLGLDIEASPHTLRHSFAVHLLTELVRQQVGSMRDGAADMRHNAYRRVMGDPLAHLQKIMGHVRITTTYIYLDSVGEAQELVDEAVKDLAEALGEADPEQLLAELAATR
ncbi:tyrosine-type recombinase/integrase [Frankia tisae]|uniref:tyrosine-type recombinase/integrase n=1 Tax=Frankia tisae TaxID=2950104 RepID=UPI0021BE32EA|nr:site-specific integrase [Frankia tisae]